MLSLFKFKLGFQKGEWLGRESEKGNNNRPTMLETLVKARPVRAQIRTKNCGLPAGPIGIQAHETVALSSSTFQRVGSSAKEVLLFACSQDPVEVRAGEDEAFSDEDGQDFERKVQSLPNPSPPLAAIVGCNLKGLSWLGQRIGRMKPFVKTEGREGHFKEAVDFHFKEAVDFPPSFDRRQGLQSRSEPILLRKSSSVSEECLMEEDFEAGSQMERGFRVSPLFHCQSTRNRKRCSRERTSSSRGEEALCNPHFEEDKEGFLGRVGSYLCGSSIIDLPSNPKIREVCMSSPSQSPESSSNPSCGLALPLLNPFGPDLPSSVSHSQSPMENRAQFASSNQLSESVNPSKSKPILPKEFQIDGLFPRKMDKVRDVLSSLDIKVHSRRKSRCSIGSRNKRRVVKYFLKSENPDVVMIQGTQKVECDRRFVGSVWTIRNKEWATLPTCGASECELLDPPLRNASFTWSNMQKSPVCKRLDRFLYSNEWGQFFPQSLEEALPRRTSDHWPIVLDTNPFKWAPTPFRFENMWLQHPNFKESFRSWWRGFQGNEWEGHKFMRRLQFVRANLKEWNKELMLREEIHWRQKARVKWVKEGDCNSKFFHKVDNGRRNRKFNKVLENESGLVLNNSESITKEILLYFEKLYTSPIGESWSVEGLDRSPISEESASRLDSLFTEEEISKAIFQLDRDKASRLDGFTIVVFQDCWDVIKEDFKISDFKPISLITSLYKIIAKVLSGRLRGVLHETIHSTQGAFVQGRQIVDVVLIANEIVDEKRRLGEKGVVLKIDFEKAYDHMSWDFLDHVLEKKGFSPRWRKWMSGCLSTVSYAILVNGNAKEWVQASRGLRQGDPLSLFLFTLVADVLSRMLLIAEERNLLKGFRVGRNRTRASHLQFADYTIFFSNTRKEELHTLKSLLLVFEHISRLKVNLDKSNIYGINLDQNHISRLAELLECKASGWPILYLVIEEISRRLNGWQKAYLSFRERITLIQSYLTHMPCYFISLFKIPTLVAAKIESQMVTSLSLEGYCTSLSRVFQNSVLGRFVVGRPTFGIPISKTI
ncbi:hypothetical protein AAG906_033313 [Vitis piasezkii]